MLTKDKCIEVLKVDENVKNSPIQLFKKNTILLYVGKCRESIIVSANGEKWVGKKDIYERQFGYIVDFQEYDFHPFMPFHVMNSIWWVGIIKDYVVFKNDAREGLINYKLPNF